MSSSSSLELELAGLASLGARLGRLTDRTRWPHDVALGPRASVPGEIVHTNDVKVHLGGGYWADLTAREAADFVGRKTEAVERKLQELKLQALEGASPGRRADVQASALTASSSSSVASGPPRELAAAASSTAKETGQPHRPAPSSNQTATASSTAPSLPLAPSKANVPAPSSAAAAGHSPAKPAATNEAELVPLLLPSGEPQRAPEDDLPLFELRLAVDSLLSDEAPVLGVRGRVEPLPPAVGGEEERKRREDREKMWAEAEEEERRLEEASKQRLPATVEAVAPSAEERPTSSSAKEKGKGRAPPPAPSASTSTASTATANVDTTPSPGSTGPDLVALQAAIDKLDLPEPTSADGEGDVPTNALAELVDEEGRPISRIAIPVASADDGPDGGVGKKHRPEPLEPKKELSAAQAERKRAERERLLDLLEAEEAAGVTGGAGTTREVRRLPDLTASPWVSDAENDDEDDDTSSGQRAVSRPAKPERRKSVQWAEADQVREFDLHEPVVLSPAVAAAGESSSPASSPMQATTGENGDKKCKDIPRGPIMKGQVVERPAPAVVPPSATKARPSAAFGSKGKEKEGAAPSTASKVKQPLVKDIAERPTSTSPPAPPALEEILPADDEIDLTADNDAYDDNDDDDNDDEGSYELSDVNSDDDDDNGASAGLAYLGLDMDEKLLMREAAVSYYRLKGALNSRGGLEGLLRGMGEAGGGDEPEFVPLNATLASDLDDVRLAPPEQSLADSKFYTDAHSTPPSSIALPTLVPGGSATGVLRNAIRVGRLENGQLVVGGDESEDDGEDGEDARPDEVEQAGKEALMWGMVGGVVVRPEDLADNVHEQTGDTLLEAPHQKSLPPPPPELPQEALPPPRGQASAAPIASARSTMGKLAPKVMVTEPIASVPSASTLLESMPPAAIVAHSDLTVSAMPETTVKQPKSILKPTPASTTPSISAPAAPTAEPMQLVGTPFERATPVSSKPPSAPSAPLKVLDDPPAAGGGGTKKMSKFRMRQLGLTEDD